MNYLTTTFSPMMLTPDTEAYVFETTKERLIRAVKFASWEKRLTSAVSHKITAKMLTALLDIPVEFNRVNLTLEKGDCLFVATPAFRATEAREFSKEEIESAGVRYFMVKIY